MRAEDSAAPNEFAGEAGTVVQAGNVQGGIHLYEKNRGFPPPRQLPMAPTRFVNRETEHEALHCLLGEREVEDGERGRPGAVSVLSGAPGIGKTALALHWAHEVRSHFADGDLYVDLQGYGPRASMTPEQALEAFLRGLDMPSDKIPETLDDRASLFRSLLIGKRVLVLIDNATSSAHVRPLLPATAGCFTVVTSRSSLPGLVTREGALRVTLDVLSADESLELLARLIGRPRVAAEPAMALRAAELCGFLPLALRIVGERVSARPRPSLAEIVEELARERHRLDALASEEDELSDTRAVFSWSYRALSGELQHSFRRLSLHAGREMSAGAAAALIGTDVASARRRLRAMAAVHLVQEVRADRFTMHDLLRRYALEMVSAVDPRQERTKTVRQGLAWYLLATDRGRRAVLPHSTAVPLVPRGDVEVVAEFADADAAMRWFDVERPNIIAALHQSMDYGQFDITWKLAASVSGFLELQSYWTDWEEGMRLGLHAARALGDVHGETVSSLILADAVFSVGRLDEAETLYEEVTRAAYRIPAGWMRGFALRGLGLVQQERGAVAAARERFQQALDVFRGSGQRRGEGMSLLSLGRCAHALLDTPRAVDLLTRAIGIFAEIGDRWTVAFGGMALAEILREAGEAERATALLRDAVETFVAFGDRHGEAAAQKALGAAYRDAGDPAEAVLRLRRAAELYEELADPRYEEVRRLIDEIESSG